MRVAVGMSGGVDSSAAAALLLEQGCAVTGVTLELCDGLCPPTSSALEAAEVCRTLGIPHFTADFSKAFRQTVADKFISEYLAGRTPNPCIECNRNIKFGKMLEYAQEQLGCEKTATGHYARIKQQNGRFLLCRAADRSKDQSYVLYSLTQRQLSSLLLPLGGLTKPEIREKARAIGLKVADRPDSQDICFVPDGDYAAFIERITGKAAPAGNFIDEDKNILGVHSGLIRYTVGQRKGLGIALGAPAYVLGKNAADNTVTLSLDEQRLFKSRIELTDVNLIAADTVPDGTRVTAKLRYRHAEQPARLFNTGDGRMILEFDKPQRAPAPGQAAVFYDGDTVIGGGTIEKGTE